MNYRFLRVTKTSRRMRRQAEAVLKSKAFAAFEKTLPPLPEDPGVEADDVKKREYELLLQKATEHREAEITAFVARKIGLR